MTDRIFCHFGLFFSLLPSWQPWKSKFWKNEKNTKRYHYTHVYHTWQSWCIVPEKWSILDHFLPFYSTPTSLTTQKNKILKKWKKTPMHIIILHMCYHKWRSWCMVPKIWSATGRNFFYSVPFFALFHPLPPLTTWKIKILKNWNQCLEISSFTKVYQKLWSYATLFLR